MLAEGTKGAKDAQHRQRVGGLRNEDEGGTLEEGTQARSKHEGDAFSEGAARSEEKDGRARGGGRYTFYFIL